MAMVPGGTPGASEYCHGPGMFPNPRVNYDGDGRSGFPSGEPTLQDQLLDMLTYKRLDSADPDAKQVYEGEESWGNPDRFGPGKAPVQTPGVTLGRTPVAEEPFKLKRAE